MKTYFAAMFVLVMLTASEVQASHMNPLVAPTAPWVPHVREVDEALAQRNVGAAERAWHDAYLAALATPGWEGLIVVGGAARRVGRAGGLRPAAETKERQSYLLALVRAREQRSLEGVLRAGEAFASMGDREVVRLCIRVAESLAPEAGGGAARQRMRALRERLTAGLLAVHHAREFLEQANSIGP